MSYDTFYDDLESNDWCGDPDCVVCHPDEDEDEDLNDWCDDPNCEVCHPYDEDLEETLEDNFYDGDTDGK